MEPFIGEIRIFAGSFAPRGWAFCNGQQLQVQENPALYAVIGNTYGGNQSVFHLPDLRGRAALHQGAGPSLTPRELGENGGTTEVTLTVPNLPVHSHVPSCQTTADTESPDGSIWANTPGRLGVQVYNDVPDTAMHPQAIQAAGGDKAHNNVQPCLGLNFIIALEGLFPPRS